MAKAKKNETWECIKSILEKKRLITKRDLVEEGKKRGCIQSTLYDTIKSREKTGEIKIVKVNKKEFLYLAPSLGKADPGKVMYYIRIIERFKKLKKEEYFRPFFNWNDIPKNKEDLLDFLAKTSKIKQKKNAKINKTDNDTITVTEKDNSLILRRDDEKGKVVLEDNDGKKYEYILKKEGGKLGVYDEYTSKELLMEALDDFTYVCKFKSVAHIPEVQEFFRKALDDVKGSREEKRDLPDFEKQKIRLYRQLQEGIFTALWIVVQNAVKEENKEFAEKLLHDNKDAVKYFFETGGINDLDENNFDKAMKKKASMKWMALDILALDKEEMLRALSVVMKMSGKEYPYFYSYALKTAKNCYDEYGYGEDIEKQLYMMLGSSFSSTEQERAQYFLRELRGR